MASTTKFSVFHKNQSIRSTCISDLPCGILLDILWRLPLKDFINSKCVCKSWRHLSPHDYFSSSMSTLIMLPLDHSTLHGWLRLVDLQDDGSIDYYSKRWPTLKIPQLMNIDTRVGNSCNGLVCICDSTSRPVAIWNPVVRKYWHLPPVYGSMAASTKISGASGLGFCPSTRKYKLIWINPTTWETNLLTLGDNNWRSIGYFPSLFNIATHHYHHHLSFGTYMNGKLHWILQNHDSQLICCFDMEKENFFHLPPPPIFSPERERNLYSWSNIGVIDDCLFICASDAILFNPDVEIWVMANYGLKDSWFKMISVKNPMIEWWHPFRQFQPIRFLKNGELLLLCANRCLISYNCKGRILKYLAVLCFDAISHSPSFISPVHLDVEMEITN